jgi:Zn-dependent protease with chaperone function
MPDRLNEILGRYEIKTCDGSEYTSIGSNDVEKVLDRLLDKTNFSEKFIVTVINSKTVNALAYPGNRIVIYTGLLDKLDTEEELSFVLAHELGHYKNNDHIRAMGRGVILTALLTVLSGNTGSETPGVFLKLLDLKYSRIQEEKADLYALNLLYDAYGDVSGAFSFMDKMDKYKFFNKLDFLSTHPGWEYRKKNIKKSCELLGYGFDNSEEDYNNAM